MPFPFPLLTAGHNTLFDAGTGGCLGRRFEGDSSDEVELGGGFEANAENGDFIGSRRQNSFEEQR